MVAEPGRRWRVGAATAAAYMAVMVAAPTIEPVSAEVSAAPAEHPSQAVSRLAVGVPVLTEHDNRLLVKLVVGTTVRVALAGFAGQPWSEPTSSSPRVLVPVWRSTDVASGDSTAIFLASQPGRAEISASAEPGCSRLSPPCLAPTLGWMVTVVVVDALR